MKQAQIIDLRTFLQYIDKHLACMGEYPSAMELSPDVIVQIKSEIHMVDYTYNVRVEAVELRLYDVLILARRLRR